MNSSAHEDDDDQGEVFLEESDIIHEVAVDDEDLPDVDEEEQSDSENLEEADDSIHIFTGHTGEVYKVTCSPTLPTPVIKGFFGRLAKEIGLLNLKNIGTGHGDSVSCLAFSFDGQLLASGGLDGLVQIWGPSGNLAHRLDGPGGGIEWISWHPRGHLILAGSEDCTIWMWNADAGAYHNMFSGHGASVTCGGFTPDGKTICIGSDDASLRIWNPKSSESIHAVKADNIRMPSEGFDTFS